MQEMTSLACRTPIDILKARIVSAAFIHDDFVRKTIAIDCLFKERGGGHFVALFGQHEINGVAEFVDSTVQVYPFSFDLNVGFIHPPGRRNDMFAFFGFCCNQRRIVDNPAVQGCMINTNTTFLSMISSRSR